MPSIAIHPAELPHINDALLGWWQRSNRDSWQCLSDRTWGKEEPIYQSGIDLIGAERSFGIFWSGARHAALNAQRLHVFDANSTGNDVLADLAVVTGYRDQSDEIIKAYTQALTDWITERETGSEELLLATVQEVLAHSSGKPSERLQGFIEDYEYCSLGLETISAHTVIEVRNLVGWLIQQDKNTFAMVTDDGILALEATLTSNERLFVEIDRSGLVEAAIFFPEIGIKGIGATTIADLASSLMVRSVDSP